MGCGHCESSRSLGRHLACRVLAVPIELSHATCLRYDVPGVWVQRQKQNQLRTNRRRHEGRRVLQEPLGLHHRHRRCLHGHSVRKLRIARNPPKLRIRRAAVLAADHIHFVMTIVAAVDRLHDAFVKPTGDNGITWATRAADGGRMGAWTIRFTGRTQRDAIINGELPYIEDLAWILKDCDRLELPRRTTLKTVRDACELQPNALSIKLGDQIEQLDQLITAEGDGTALLEKTQITQGMQDLISESIARLAGASSQKQAMGGGKTHLLVGCNALSSERVVLLLGDPLCRRTPEASMC